MRPKRNETAKQAVERWADELLASQGGDMYYALNSQNIEPLVTVWKYKLPQGYSRIQVPGGGKVLSVGCQNKELVVWVEVGPMKEELGRMLYVACTGDTYTANKQFVGTVIMEDGTVLHVFDCGLRL